MSSTAAGDLKELHQLHLKLKEVNDELERGPRLVRARGQFAEKKQVEHEAQKTLITQLRKAVDQKNLQLRTNESKINDLRAKLNAASSNREFDIIKAQIEADTVANSVLEDEVLEILDKVDQAQRTLEEIDEQVAKAKADQATLNKANEAKAPGLLAIAEELNAQIRDHERTLSSEVAATYHRLVKAHGAGALTNVSGNACGSCFVELTRNQQVDLKLGKLLFCRTCGRLMYRDDSDT